MIDRKLLDPPVTKEIASAIAHVRQIETPPSEHDRRQGRPHPPSRHITGALLVDHLTRPPHRVGQMLSRCVLKARRPLRRLVEVYGPKRHIHGLHGELTRAIARGVPTHPVGHTIEAKIRREENRVFVMIPLPACVR